MDDNTNNSNNKGIFSSYILSINTLVGISVTPSILGNKAVFILCFKVLIQSWAEADQSQSFKAYFEGKTAKNILAQGDINNVITDTSNTAETFHLFKKTNGN